MEWIFDNLPVVFFFFVIYQIAAAVKRARDKKAEHEQTNNETDEQRRVREIQERIRRIAAERRGGRVPADAPTPRRVESAPSELDPFGGPLKRMFDEVERHVRPAVEPPPLVVQANRAEIEHQERLAEELRAAEQAKEVARRRAAHLRDARLALENPVTLQRAAARSRLLEDLRDPQSVRRAFVLREVLGPPVAMR